MSGDHHIDVCGFGFLAVFLGNVHANHGTNARDSHFGVELWRSFSPARDLGKCNFAATVFRIADKNLRSAPIALLLCIPVSVLTTDNIIQPFWFCAFNLFLSKFCGAVIAHRMATHKIAFHKARRINGTLMI